MKVSSEKLLGPTKVPLLVLVLRINPGRMEDLLQILQVNHVKFDRFAGPDFRKLLSKFGLEIVDYVDDQNWPEVV